MGLERGGDCLCAEGPRRGALGRGGVCSTAGEASEGPYRGVGPWAERVCGLFRPGEDFGHPSIDEGSASRADLARVPSCVLRILGYF